MLRNSSYIIFSIVLVKAQIITISVKHLGEWIHPESHTISRGSVLRLRCEITHHGPEEALKINLSKKFPGGTQSIIQTNISNVLYWKTINANFTDTGSYDCVYGGISDVLSIDVYSFTEAVSAVAPTATFTDVVGDFTFLRRALDYNHFYEDGRWWMSCTCAVSTAHRLESITVKWEGALLDLLPNQINVDDLYQINTTRNYARAELHTMIRLKHPVSDFRVFGEYRCVYSFAQFNRVSQTVSFSVPPILRLVHDPPPLPPENSAGRFLCRNPPCITKENASKYVSKDGVSNWTSACEVVAAYPPISSPGLTWQWSVPSRASEMIYRVQRLGHFGALSEFLSIDSEEDHQTIWQVLERRRRSVNHTGSKNSYKSTTPVIFFCSAENSIGRTDVWWPQAERRFMSTYWSSFLWPVLGVFLEVLSLLIVFWCCGYWRRRKLVSVSANEYSVDNTSFGLSRLFDANSSTRGRESNAATKRASHHAVACFVPYTRLSTTTLNMMHKIENHEHGSVSGHENLLMMDPQHILNAESDSSQGGKQHPANGPDTDEYFWDSDGESHAGYAK